MTISNLIFNLNYKNTIGQSSIVDHLITYSNDVGCLPQQLHELGNTPVYMWNNKEEVVGLPNIDPDFKFLVKEDNFIDILKEKIIEYTDIERNKILDSNFTFMLPGSIFPGLLMSNKEQRKFFAKPNSYYVWEYNKRFKKENVTVLNEYNLGKIKRKFNIDSGTNFLKTLNIIANKINPQDPGSAIDFIKDKPLSLVHIAVQNGLSYAIEQGIKEFEQDFFDIEIDEDFSSLEDVIIDTDKLLDNNKSSGIDYYKYMCKQLDINSNLDLYNEFYEYFVNVDDYTRLHILTKSDYIADILHNDFKDRD